MTMRKLLFWGFGPLSLVFSTALSQTSRLDLPYFQRTLTSIEASSFAKKNGDTYNKKNWLNPVLHNLYMTNNRSETAQHRISLENISKMTRGRLRFIDMLGNEPIDWTSMTEDLFSKDVQRFHSIVGIDTTNIDRPRAPVVVLFSSASHTLISSSTLDVVSDLSYAGYVVVTMEYPGYGGSMGTPTKANWQLASDGLVGFLKKAFPQQPLFLVGHSIGSSVALETASHWPKDVDGVISHAGIYNLSEASKDSSKFLFSDWIAPLVTKLMASKEAWDAGASLQLLSQNSIPTLILHGRQDQSVSFRHYELLTSKSAQLKKAMPDFPVFAQAFDSTHEDIYANSNYGAYYDIWAAILTFIRHSKEKPALYSVRD